VSEQSVDGRRVGLDDQALRERLLEGDHAAFAEVFDRYAQLVYRVAWRWTRHEQDAEDLVSATFLTVWQRRQDSHVIDESLRPWLLAITTNLARNASRGQRRRTLGLVRAAGHVMPPAAVVIMEDQVLDRVDAARDAALVSVGIERLPQGEREVALLCLLEGLPVSEAAHALGLSQGTVRSRLFRARASLRGVLHSGEATERGHGRGHLPNDRPAPAGDESTGARR
jgi:RNA polymerase sigma-70 factor (ECF subfamily)